MDPRSGERFSADPSLKSVQPPSYFGFLLQSAQRTVPPVLPLRNADPKVVQGFPIRLKAALFNKRRNPEPQ